MKLFARSLAYLFAIPYSYSMTQKQINEARNAVFASLPNRPLSHKKLVTRNVAIQTKQGALSVPVWLKALSDVKSVQIGAGSK